MAPSEADLEAFAAHCREQFAGPGTPSRRAVQLRVVEPLLERLGWDLRTEDVEPDVDLGDWHVDYLLHVDGVPVIAVVAVEPGTDLEAGPVADAAEGLGQRGVEWALVTDGRRFAVLARADGESHVRTLSAADLPAARSAIVRFTRSAAHERLADAGRGRTRAARRLAEHREEAIESVTDAVVDVAGDSLGSEARTAAATLVDALVTVADGSEPDGTTPDDTATAGTGSDPAGSGAVEEGTADARPEPDERDAGAGAAEQDVGESGAGNRQTPDGPRASGAQRGVETGSGVDGGRDGVRIADEDDGATRAGEADAQPATAGGEAAESATADEEPARPPDDARQPPPSAGDGEYVVRFFGGGASVGAVGTDHPGSTLAGAVSYLAERHGLAQSITLPWGGASGRAIVAAAPEHPDGQPMEYYRALDGGVYVCTDVDVAVAKESIADLSEAAGLRAMFQGDW